MSHCILFTVSLFLSLDYQPQKTMTIYDSSSPLELIPCLLKKCLGLGGGQTVSMSEGERDGEGVESSRQLGEMAFCIIMGSSIMHPPHLLLLSLLKV